MQLLTLVLVAGYFDVIKNQVNSQEISVTRHPDGDIFTVEDSCTEACVVLSSGTASPFSYATSSSAGIPVSNNSCTCQCNSKLPVFREDLTICVKHINECTAANFIGNSGTSENVPYVFLPQRGQIIYPNAEIRFEGVKIPVCGFSSAQQLGIGGWSELRNLSVAESPVKFFPHEGRTYLKWMGDSGLRDAAEGRVVVVRLNCRDKDPEKLIPEVLSPCVAFRVAGSPSKNSVREVIFVADAQSSQGLSTIEYTAIGLSSILLALIYVASVLLYLHSRKTKRKRVEEPEAGLNGGRDSVGIVKNNPLLSAGRHFESDTNSGLSESEIGDDAAQSDGEQGFENVTSAVVHPHYSYLESEGMFGSGSILGERLPEEDVRIVETIENTQHQEPSALPGTQRRKLYFNPAYFDRQLLLAPPPAAIEFLFKIREVISIAKHKMAAKRFVPTLVGIPEEELNLEKSNRTGLLRRGSSAQGSVARSRKSQGCTGCPGCRESPPSIPAVPVPSHLCLGESRIRAWLEDVKPPERKWKDAEDSRRNFAENARTFAKNLEYLKEMAKSDFANPDKMNSSMSSSWKDNPPMLRTFRNIAKSEKLDNDDNFSISKRSTRSMFEESNYNRYYNLCNANMHSFDMNDTVNAKVRKAIENSFIKQMEENATLESLQCLEKKLIESQSVLDRTPTPTDSHKSAKSSSKGSTSNTPTRRLKKSRAPPAPKKLPDMIKELPNGKSPTKRLMDEVIQEMVVAKALEHRPKPTKVVDYEVDSLERSKCSFKSSSSPDSTDRHSSPALSTALPMDEELTMQNAIFNIKTGAMTISKLKNDGLDSEPKKTTLSELILPRPQNYSLVSEVYVNDGYASPAGSDSSGPEIQYEPENPGHLTIKVLDSPDNYVKQDDSEYEPDTLDRKPMKLKINGDVRYERGHLDEVFVDSLERPAHISLRSKGSFRTEDSNGHGKTPFERNYGSLREIYEARLRSNLKNSALLSSTRSLNGDPEDNTLSWKKTKYLTPETKHARRQRAPQNQPDVVPVPTVDESIYQQPKPPRLIESMNSKPPLPPPKNGRDRSRVDTGVPTASEITSVPVSIFSVGDIVKSLEEQASETCLCRQKIISVSNSLESLAKLNDLDRKMQNLSRSSSRSTVIGITGKDNVTEKNIFPVQEYENVSSLRITNTSSPKSREMISTFVVDTKSYPPARRTLSAHRLSGSERRRRQSAGEPRCMISDGCIKFLPSSKSSATRNQATVRNSPRNVSKTRMIHGVHVTSSNYNKVEDSGYLSSTDSNGSHKQLLRQDVSSVSETDETESVCDGASESGAESVGTDSVFFGNFRKLSEMSSFSKSVDSGVDLNVRNPYFQAFGIRNEGGVLERSNYAGSDSETDSFMTVLPPEGRQRNSLIL